MAVVEIAAIEMAWNEMSWLSDQLISALMLFKILMLKSFIFRKSTEVSSLLRWRAFGRNYSVFNITIISNKLSIWATKDNNRFWSKCCLWKQKANHLFHKRTNGWKWTKEIRLRGVCEFPGWTRGSIRQRVLLYGLPEGCNPFTYGWVYAVYK